MGDSACLDIWDLTGGPKDIQIYLSVTLESLCWTHLSKFPQVLFAQQISIKYPSCTRYCASSSWGDWYRTSCPGRHHASSATSGVPLCRAEWRAVPHPYPVDRKWPRKLSLTYSHPLSTLSFRIYWIPSSGRGPSQEASAHQPVPTTWHREDRSGSVNPVPEVLLLPFVLAMTLSQPWGGKHQGIWDHIQVSQKIHYTIRSQHWSNLF